MTAPTLPPGATPPASPADAALGAHAAHFWNIPPRGWWHILQRTYAQANDDNLTVLAAGVAFYAFLSVAPLLAAVSLVYGLTASPADAAEHVGALAAMLPADVGGIIRDQVAGVVAAPAPELGLGLAIALAVAIYGVTRASGAVVAALNIVYGERERRSFLHLLLLTYALAAGAVLTALLLLAAVAITAAFGGGGTAANSWSGARAALLGLAATAGTGLIAAIYRYGPCRERVRWIWLPPGAILAVLLSGLMTLAFGLYASRITDFHATYGTLGAVAAFLMWLFFNAYAILLGGELNAEIERQTAVDSTDGAEQPMGQRGAAMADQCETGPDVDAAD